MTSLLWRRRSLATDSFQSWADDAWIAAVLAEWDFDGGGYDESQETTPRQCYRFQQWNTSVLIAKNWYRSARFVSWSMSSRSSLPKRKELPARWAQCSTYPLNEKTRPIFWRKVYILVIPGVTRRRPAFFVRNLIITCHPFMGTKCQSRTHKLLCKEWNSVNLLGRKIHICSTLITQTQIESLL